MGSATANDTGGSPGEPAPTKPIDTPTSFDGLNPENVYLLGTLKEAISYDALAQVDSPDSYVVGFDSHAFGYGLGDDGLYYASGEHVYRFVVDASLDLPVEEVDYPEDPRANDVLVDTPRCQAGAFSGFILGSTGRLIYGCSDLTDIGYVSYYEGMDVVLEPGSGCVPDAVGANDLVLCNTGHTPGILNLKKPTETIDVEALTQYALTSRAHGDGFLVAEASYPPTLWQVNADGSADKLGEYPPDPEGLFTGSGPTALSPDGALYEITRHKDGGGDVIVRYTIEGAADIVYDEADHPNVKIHSGRLITGN